MGATSVTDSYRKTDVEVCQVAEALRSTRYFCNSNTEDWEEDLAETGDRRLIDLATSVHPLYLYLRMGTNDQFFI